MLKQSFGNSGVKSRVADAKDNLVNDGKSALQTGFDIAAGQAALAVLRSFVVPAKVSVVDRLTGKGAIIKKIANSTYGSLAIASTFHIIASMTGSTKLQKVAKLALDAATVEAASTLPIQDWVESISDKLFKNAAITKVLATSDTESK